MYKKSADTLKANKMKLKMNGHDIDDIDNM